MIFAGVFQAHVLRPRRTSYLCGVRERCEPATKGHHSAEQGAGLICYSRSRSRLFHPVKEGTNLTQIYGFTAPQTALARQIGPEQGGLSGGDAR